MRRSFVRLTAVAVAFVLAGCTTAAEQPTWTFAPAPSQTPAAPDAGSSPPPVESLEPTATPAPTPSPTPTPTPTPTATPAPTPTPTPTARPTIAPATPTPAPTLPPAPTPTPTPALGTADDPRVIEISMENFAFEPGSLTVRVGEVVRFVVTNPTTLPHELVLGDAEEQLHHAKEMAEGSGHMDDHMKSEDHMMSEPNEIEVEPGGAAELDWVFDAPGEILMGCHIAGHWEAGMRGTIEVVS